jgi:hypothetical protein
MQKVRVVVEESYGVAGGVSLPFEDKARDLLKYAGIKVVGADAEDYDITLRIQAKGRARAPYHHITYSSASLYGLISLEIKGVPVYSDSF